jgi:hypothetical protein
MAKNKKSKPAPAKKNPKKLSAKPASKPQPKSAAKPAKVASKTASKAAPKALKLKAKPAPKAVKPPAKAVAAKVAPAKVEAKKAEKPAKLAAVVDPKVAAKAAKPAKAPALPAELGKKAKLKAAQIIRDALTEAAMTALPEKEVVLTNADGMRYCKVADCDELATSDSYCRFHYLLNWKKIQLRKRILAGDKLDRYIEELTARYPDKFLEMIRKDLANEKDFLQAIQELEIDDSGDDVEFEDDARTYIDEVRGVTTGGEGDEEF